LQYIYTNFSKIKKVTEKDKTSKKIKNKAATGNPNYILTPAIAYAHRRKLKE